jgi:hypothetical protein
LHPDALAGEIHHHQRWEHLVMPSAAISLTPITAS